MGIHGLVSFAGLAIELLIRRSPGSDQLRWVLFFCWFANFGVSAGYSVWMAFQSLRAEKTERTFIQAGAPLAEQDLPSYTILLPLYREAEVSPQLIQAICNLDYPRKRMQVLCVVRPTDEETLRALTQCGVRLMEKQEHVTHYTQAARSATLGTAAASAADART